MNTAQPAWLSQYKESWEQRFEDLGYPTKRDESWRYMSVRPISSADWAEGTGSAADYQSSIRSSAQLIFVNGHYQSGSGAAASGGLTVLPLRQAITDGVPGLEEDLKASHGLEKEPFVALNSRDFVDGAYVSVAAGTEVEHPIELVFITTAGVKTSPRVVYRGLANSRSILLERFIGATDQPYFTNTVTQVGLRDGAALEHIRIQDEGVQAYHIGFTKALQGRDTSYTSHSFALGSLAGRSEIHVEFEGQGASCSLNGLYAPTAGQNHDNYTLIDHRVPHCTSNEYYKAIVNIASTGSFQGRVLIRAGASGSSSDQLNRNLLLGDAAVANSKPQLEIDNDDVRATHGSTIGQLDQDSVFYLMARGLPRAEARAFLMRAFAAELIELVRPGDLREEILRAFDVRLAEIGVSA